jgi:membrane associated rhomboid family serine protease
MTAASVGFHCPECLHQGAKAAPVYTARTLPGFQPVVTYVIIALNVLVFVAQLATIGGGNPLTGSGGGDLVQQLILYGPFVAAGEYWRLITGGFLHAGLLHIGMNMYVLWVLGPQLERLFGRFRFAALYIAALLAGSLGVMLAAPLEPTLGASGAIFGLLGAAAAVQLANRVNIWQSGLGTLILINVGISFLPGISWAGHFGGLLGGGAVGYAMVLLEQRRMPPAVGAAVALGAALLFAVAAILVAPSAPSLLLR